MMTRMIPGTVRYRRQRLVERALRETVAELAVAASAKVVIEVVDRAITSLSPSRCGHEVRIHGPEDRSSIAGAGSGEKGRLVPIEVALPGKNERIGALLVDRATASRPDLRLPLEIMSVHAAQALERLRLIDEVNRQRSHAEIQALVEQTADVILIIDDNNRIRYASPSARILFGTSTQYDGSLLDLVDHHQRQSAEFLLRHARSGEGISAAARADWTMHTLDGRTVLAEVSCRDMQAEGTMRGVVVTLRDMTAQRRLERELTQRMFHDPLTGLANRAFFTDRVGHAVATDKGITGVLLIDLDDFRSTNDTFGHMVGDDVLMAVARRLVDTIGADGVAARFGDDEFAALIRDAEAVEAVDSMASRVTEALGVPLRSSGGVVVTCGASVGVTTSAQGSSAHELLRNANLALTAAKSAGTGQWRHYQPATAEAIRGRAEMRAALGRALHDGSLFVEYQPIVALKTGRAVGFEALLRYQHPTHGRLSPGEFIDIAEESGSIVPIGEWTLATAVDAARRWHTAMPANAPYVSVNVSAQQFRSGDFVDVVHRLLVGTRLPAHRLVLEVTESLLLRDDDEVWERLRQLRSRGIRIAIDDFGTGYSALSYLRQTVLDIVKLDRLFISTLPISSRQRELVEGIIALARTLNLDVVAEGIETEDQREITAAIGCGYGQGYLFGRAMPEADALRWLAGERAPESP